MQAPNDERDQPPVNEVHAPASSQPRQHRRCDVFRPPATTGRLYEEVWAEPTQTVAGRYGVSDVAIAKACTLLDIPKPPRGYWAKKAAGQKLPQRPALPKYDR